MKKQVCYLLMLFVVAIVLFPGCKKEHFRKYTDTTFTLKITEYQSDVDNTGYFTSTGDPATAGSFAMHVTLVGADSLHCSQVLTVPSVGTITVGYSP